MIKDLDLICKYCGSRSVVYEGWHWHHVRCDACGAHTLTGKYRSEDGAISAWHAMGDRVEEVEIPIKKKTRGRCACGGAERITYLARVVLNGADVWYMSSVCYKCDSGSGRDVEKEEMEKYGHIDRIPEYKVKY